MLWILALLAVPCTVWNNDGAMTATPWATKRHTGAKHSSVVLSWGVMGSTYWILPDRLQRCARSASYSNNPALDLMLYVAYLGLEDGERQRDTAPPFLFHWQWWCFSELRVMVEESCCLEFRITLGNVGVEVNPCYSYSVPYQRVEHQLAPKAPPHNQIHSFRNWSKPVCFSSRLFHLQRK